MTLQGVSQGTRNGYPQLLRKRIIKSNGIPPDLIFNYIEPAVKGILKSLIIFAIALLAGCSRPIEGLYPPDPNQTDNKTVYLVNHELHTGMVLPKKDASPYLRSFDDFKHAYYLEIGWGDAAYYQTEEATITMGLKALLWPTDSVLHVVALRMDPVSYFPNSEVVLLELSHKGFIKLVEFVDSSFALNEKNRTIRLGHGLYGESSFYRAKGTFYLFNNCNTWTANAIRSSGFPISTFYVYTSGNILYQVRRITER